MTKRVSKLGDFTVGWNVGVQREVVWVRVQEWYNGVPYFCWIPLGSVFIHFDRYDSLSRYSPDYALRALRLGY